MSKPFSNSFLLDIFRLFWNLLDDSELWDIPAWTLPWNLSIMETLQDPNCKGILNAVIYCSVLKVRLSKTADEQMMNWGVGTGAIYKPWFSNTQNWSKLGNSEFTNKHAHVSDTTWLFFKWDDTVVISWYGTRGIISTIIVLPVHVCFEHQNKVMIELLSAGLKQCIWCVLLH